MTEVPPLASQSGDVPADPTLLDGVPSDLHDWVAGRAPLPPQHGGDISSTDLWAAARRVVDEAYQAQSAGHSGQEHVETSPSGASPTPPPEADTTDTPAEPAAPEGGEEVRDAPKITVLFQRHGEPFRPGEMPDDPELVSQLGWLTETGVRQAREEAQRAAREILARNLAEGTPTTFFFVASPSAYYLGGEARGRRSEQSARVEAEAVFEVIQEMGLTSDQARIHVFGEDTKKLTAIKTTTKTAEPGFYHVYESETPRRYVDALKAKTGTGPEHIEEWVNGADPELEAIREEIGAESPGQVADRVGRFFGVLERYARIYQGQHPGEDMVFFAPSHGEVQRAVIQHMFGAGEAANGKVYAMSEIMPITVEDFVAQTTFNGHTYEVDLLRPKKGDQ